jgi:hypothetical protein
MQTVAPEVKPAIAVSPKAAPRPFYKILLPFVYGIILLLAFFISYSKVFDEKIALNGDDTGYYLLGKAIAGGKGYANVYEVGNAPHNHFPPGYPAIIAVMCKLFSSDLIFIKQVNGFFLLGSIALLCLITWKIGKNIHITFLAALFSLLNAHLLEFSVSTMSEVPFLFFSLLCINLAMRTHYEKPVFKNISFWLLIICLSFTYHVRTTGISLLIGLLAFLLLRKNWTYALASFLGFVVLALPWYLRGKSLGGNSYLSQLVMKNAYQPELGKMGIADWFERFYVNLVRYFKFEIPACIGGIKFANYNESSGGAVIAAGVMIELIIVGLFMLKHKAENLFTFFIISYFAILLLWPDVWTGVRFMLPLLPLLLFLMIYGVFGSLQWVFQKLKIKNDSTIAVVAILVIAAFLIKPYTGPLDVLAYTAQNDFPTPFRNYFNVAEWAKDNTPDSSVVVCRKEEMFYLFSDRQTAPFLRTKNTEEQLAYLLKGNIDYVVVDALGYTDTYRYLVPAIQKYPAKFRTVIELPNPKTYILQILR